MRSLVLCGVVAGLAAVSTGVSLTSPYHQQEKPIFKAGVDLVQLNVSVLDKDRRPVRGLRVADFAVRENGKPQTIEVFNEFDLPGAEASGAAWMHRVPADIETNAGDTERLVAIILDDAMIPQDPLFVRQTKLIGREVVNRLGPRDAATVVFSRDNRAARSFTTDHARLLAAIDTFNGGTAFSQPDDYPLWAASEITISNVADTLVALPNRLKMIVLVSVGIGYYPQIAAPTTSMHAEVDLREKQIQLQTLLQDTLNRARRANVSIYSFDPGGLSGLANYCRGGAGRCPPPNSQRLPPSDYFRGFQDYLTILPANTGGRPTLFTNDPIPGIDDMFAANQSFYLLGYRQATPPKINEYRRVDVSVNRKGVQVRSANLSYREPTADERASKLRESPPTAGTKAIVNVIPDASIPMRLNLIPFARTDGPGATVIITVGVSEPAPLAPGTEAIDVLMRAFTLEGEPRGERSSTARVRITAAPVIASVSAPPMSYEVIDRLDIPKPGRYAVRVGIENKARAIAGSVFADLDVPDFTSPLSLSGIVVGSSSAPVSATIDSPGPILPVAPTTERTFSPSDRSTAMVRLYEGGNGPVFPITMRTTVRDKSDALVFDRTETLPAGRFAAERYADVRFDLPLGSLQTGPHLLTFEGSGHDRVVRREVIFKIR